MRLYLTRTDATEWQDPTAGTIAFSLDAVRTLGLQEGAPFFLAADGSYDLELSAFFRALPGEDVASPHSWRAYALDIELWCRFLESRRHGRSWKDATENDLIAYRVARRDATSPALISPQSWNRALVAIERLYKWALREGRVAKLPFRMAIKKAALEKGLQMRGVQSQESTASVLRDKRGKNLRTIRYLSMEDYEFWRDIGLRGFLPDGDEDEAWRGRHGERNALLADMLVKTGMRISEGSSILAWEMELDDTQRHRAGTTMPFWVSNTAKGGRPRDVHMPVSCLRRAIRYCELERHSVLRRAAAAADDPGIERAILRVQRRAGDMYWLSDRRKCHHIADANAATRRRLYSRAISGEWSPALLFIDDKGRPMQIGAWTEVFREANRRCARFGRRLNVTPHWLRHTFAVHYLVSRITQLQKAGDMASGEIPGAVVYRKLISDPLDDLRVRLGHADITTTYGYLGHLREIEGLVISASDRERNTQEGDPS